MIIYSKYSIYTLSNVVSEGRSHVCNDEERLRRLRKDLPRSVCFFALFSSAVRAGGESSMHLFWRITVSWLSHIMFLNLIIFLNLSNCKELGFKLIRLQYELSCSLLAVMDQLSAM